MLSVCGVDLCVGNQGPGARRQAHPTLGLPFPPFTRAVGTLRHLRDFFNVQFSIRPEEETRTIFLSCVGAGVKNLSKKIA